MNRKQELKEMTTIMTLVLNIAEIGLKNNLKPKEVVDYILEIFSDFNNRMEKMQEQPE